MKNIEMIRATKLILPVAIVPSARMTVMRVAFLGSFPVPTPRARNSTDRR